MKKSDQPAVLKAEPVYQRWITSVFVSIIVSLSFASCCEARRISLEGIGISIRYTDRVYRYKSDHLDTGQWSRGLIFPRSYVPLEIEHKEYATHDFRPAFDDSRTNDAIHRIKADETGDLLIAMPSEAASGNGWVRLKSGSGPDFHLDYATRSGEFTPDPKSPYWFYTRKYTTPGTWVSLPDNSVSTDHPPFVFASKGELAWENPPALQAHGVVITKKPDGGEITTVANPKLLVMPNGDYLASLKGAVGTSATSVWKSVDHGKTWDLLADGLFLNRDSLFEHRGSIYLLGMNTSGSGRTRIYKSSDGGDTWITKSFAGRGGEDAPSHVDISHGRIWKAALANGGAGFFSAPVASDLMQESSWTLSSPGRSGGRVTLSNGQRFESGNEGTLLTTKEGIPVSAGKDRIYRPEVGGCEGISMVQADLHDIRTTTHDPDYAGPKLPGSSSKYTVRYDPVSGRYWALTSGGTNRGELNLYSASSDNGRIGDFHLEQTVLEGHSTGYHGFNYPFMEFDGDDLIFVSRTAWDHSRGTSDRWHDADLFTFHRVENFRSSLTGNGT